MFSSPLIRIYQLSVVIALLIVMPVSAGPSGLVVFNDPNFKLAVEAELGFSDPNEADMLSLTTLNIAYRGFLT